MTLLPFRRLAAWGVLLAFVAVARGEHPLIAKARAFVGPEEVLVAVKSVHYVGSLVTPDPTDAKKMTYVTVEIIVQDPYQQRITASSDRSVEVTALDGYDAWHRVQDPKDSTRWRMQLLGTDQIKRLRANTWENLAFYRGLEREGGRVVDQGDATKDGIACRKLAFIHAGGVVFLRYFDAATGRLVVTESESGVSIREQGEIRVNGLRFPKSIVTATRGDDGREKSVTLTFDQITLNESFPASTFAIPSLHSR